MIMSSSSMMSSMSKSTSPIELDRVVEHHPHPPLSSVKEGEVDFLGVVNRTIGSKRSDGEPRLPEREASPEPECYDALSVLGSRQGLYVSGILSAGVVGVDWIPFVTLFIISYRIFLQRHFLFMIDLCFYNLNMHHLFS